MILYRALAAGFLTLLLGCATARTAPPLQLRLYDIANNAVLIGSATNDGSGHGAIEILLPGGERAVGEYTTIPGGVTGWGSIYALVFGGGKVGSVGARETVTVQPNTQQGSFAAVGDKGTAIECEYLVNLQNHGHGACRDNHGRVYKLLY